MRIRTALPAIGVLAMSMAFAAVTLAQTAAPSPAGTPSPTATQNAAITFPVAALGNCTDEAACHAYCNDPANMQACTAFAENHGLESASDAQKANEFAALFKNGGGPGGCSSPDACNTYCSTVSHLDACVAFAKQNNISNDSLTQAEQIQTYLKNGGQMPGGCDSKSSCNTYCSDDSHMQVCQKFAESVGLGRIGGNPNEPNDVTPAEEQAFSKLLQSGNTPGGCTTLTSCLEYCNDPSHGSACGSFGQVLGVQGNEKVTQAGPGGCTSDASCKTYCSDPSHAAECQAFESQSGQQGPVQAGPGGCTTDASCQAYCSDPSHATECQAFAHQSNYVAGSSTATGSPQGGCGEDHYWNGSACVASPTMSPGGTPPPCPAGQQCNFNMDGGPPPGTPGPTPATSSAQSSLPFSSMMANIANTFGSLVQTISHSLFGN